MTLKRLQPWVGLVLLVLIAAGCSGLAGEPSIVATMPPATAAANTVQTVSVPSTAPDLALGASVYAANCTRCHGTEGKGDGEFVTSGQITGVPDFTNPQTAQGATPEDWYEIVTNGRMAQMMPPWADKLSDDERWSVANYVYSLSNPDANPPEQAGAAVAQADTPVGTPVDTSGATPVATQAATQAGTEAVSAVTGSVSGTVTNQTTDGSVPSDLMLNLHVISSDGASTQTLNTTVNADGSYSFADVPIETGWQYLVTTAYSGVSFSSDLITGDVASPEMSIPLNIYEITDDPANIEIGGMLMMVQPDSQAGQLQIIQIINFVNSSDHAFVQMTDGIPASSSVTLPTGATYEDFSGGNYLINGSVVSDTQPVFPGDGHVMHVAFSLPYSDNTSLAIAQPMSFPLNGQVEVLVQSGSMSVAGDGISELGTRQLGNANYVSYGGAFALATGDTLHYAIGGAATSQQASTTAPVGGVSTVAYVLIGVGLLAIGAAFGFFMRERTGGSKTDTPETLDANGLIKQIAELDVRYHEGKVAEASYQQQRSALKARLMMQMKNQAESSS